MKRLSFIVWSAILFLSGILLFSNPQKNTILVIETGSNNPTNFKKTLDALRIGGYDPIFKQAYNVSPTEIESHNAILFLLDSSFYNATSRDLSLKKSIQSPMLKHVYMLIDHLKTKKNSTIGIAIPVAGNPLLIASITERLLEKVELLENKNLRTLRSISCFISHLAKSNASKSIYYKTALLDRRSETIQELSHLNELQRCNHVSAEFLPNGQNDIPHLSPLHPLGFKIKNNKTGNTFFLTNMDTFYAQEIKEPFTLTPMNKKLREKLNQQIDQRR